jgi:NAD-dependent dihydropyrimidine dehydrogenase PreA subunit
MLSEDRVRVFIDGAACSGCGQCLLSCPTDVFRIVTREGRQIADVAYPNDCCSCFFCELDCPEDCITVNMQRAAHGFTSIYDRMGVAITPFGQR